MNNTVRSILLTTPNINRKLNYSASSPNLIQNKSNKHITPSKHNITSNKHITPRSGKSKNIYGTKLNTPSSSSSINSSASSSKSNHSKTTPSFVKHLANPSRDNKRLSSSKNFGYNPYNTPIRKNNNDNKINSANKSKIPIKKIDILLYGKEILKKKKKKKKTLI